MIAGLHRRSPCHAAERRGYLFPAVRLVACAAMAVFFMLQGAGNCLGAGEYTISMLPRYATEEISRRISPLASYLSAATGIAIRPVLTADFREYLKMLSSGAIDIGFQDPAVYVLADRFHEVVAMAVKEERHGDRFRGVVVTRSDSPITSLAQLRGRHIAVVSLISSGGFLSQKLTLAGEGIDVTRDCIVEEVPGNKHENVLLSVYTGGADAGFVRESALGQTGRFIPPDALRVVAETAWLPNWVLSVEKTMNLADRKKILRALFDLTAESKILEAMKVQRFRPAFDRECDVVRRAAGLLENTPGPQEGLAGNDQ